MMDVPGFSLIHRCILLRAGTFVFMCVCVHGYTCMVAYTWALLIRDIIENDCRKSHIQHKFARRISELRRNLSKASLVI